MPNRVGKRNCCLLPLLSELISTSTRAFTRTISPGPVSDLLVRTAYTAAYDRRNRIPAWTAEHLNAASLKSGGGDRQSATFREDPDVPEMFQAKLLDYFRSGYGQFLSFRAGLSCARLAADEENRTDSLSSPPPTSCSVRRNRPRSHGPGRRRETVPASHVRNLPPLQHCSASRRRLQPALLGLPRSGTSWVLHSKRCPVVPSLYNSLYEAGPAHPRLRMLTGAGAWRPQFCRDLTKSFEDVYVFTVPLFLPKRDGRDGKWRVVRFLLLCTPESACLDSHVSPGPCRPTR